MFVQSLSNETVWAGEAESFRDIVESLAGTVPFDRVAWRDAVMRARRERISLSRAPLRDMDLSGADLRSVDLTGADMRRTRLQGAWLDDAIMTAVDLTGADLRDARMNNAALADAVLVGAQGDGAVLARADLRRARLDGAVFRSVSFAGAKLVGARLDRGCFTDSDFSTGALGRASFRWAELSGCTWAGAAVYAANFTGSTVSVEALACAADFDRAIVPERGLEQAGAATGSAGLPGQNRREIAARIERFVAEEVAASRNKVALSALGVNIGVWLERRTSADLDRLAVSSRLEILVEAARGDEGVRRALLSLGVAATG